jgi:proteasome beta subunit
MFEASSSPGPNFTELLRRLELDPFAGLPYATSQHTGATSTQLPFEVRHSTTIVALRFADGVVMAGDRRATAGPSIAHRAMDKVHPADRYSGVAIAGAAGPAMEMVKLFQLQLEHYEKVEGSTLSLDGKANQLAQMVRSHLGMALQGFVVVPLFAGYDLKRATGRIYSYDPTGGRYEETDFHADGSGGRDAKTTIKLGWSEGLSRSRAVELAVSALWNAADEDSATGGPDAVRGIYPSVATITSEGFEYLDPAEVAQRFAAVVSLSSRSAPTPSNQPEEPLR